MQAQENKVDRQANPLGPRCTVCDHPQIEIIDRLCAQGDISIRDIASQFTLDRSAIDRHKRNHVPQRLQGAIARRKLDSDDAFLDGLLKSARRMDKGVIAGLQALEATGEDQLSPELLYRMAPSFMAQSLRARELIGQATGRLGQAQAAGGINVNLQIVIPRGAEPTLAVTPELPAIDLQVLQVLEPGDTPSE